MAKDYMRNRPFLLATITVQPRPGVATHVKGWQNDPNNLRHMENVSIADRVNRNDYKHDIIIDIVNAKIVQNRTRLTDDEALSDYFDRYKDSIQKALEIWAGNEVERRGLVEAEATAEAEATEQSA